MKYIWQINIAILCIAVLPLPYGYYELLRLVVCLSAVALVLRHIKRWEKDFGAWPVILGGIALLYNPFLPVYLPKIIWIVVNLATALAFYRHYQLDPPEEEAAS